MPSADNELALRVAATPREVLKIVERAEQWLLDRRPDEDR
jgi:hypothetical protein